MSDTNDEVASHRDALARRSTRNIAILAGIFGLLGALIGGGASYLAAARQADSQSSQSQADFLRNQRQVLYQKFISDWTDLGAVDYQLYLLGISGISSSEEATTFVAEYQQRNRDLSTITIDRFQISQIGSPAVIDIAHSLYTLQFDVLPDSLDLSADFVAPYDHLNNYARQAQRAIDANTATSQDLKLFDIAVRKDLGAS